MDNPINDVIDRPIKKRKKDAIDRISPLPDFIIHRILALLPRRDAAKTCVLSKRWEHLWASFPILEFEQKSFGLESLVNMDPKCFNKERFPELWEAMEKFTSHVDHTLHRFCGHHKFRVEKFKLMITLVDPSLTSLVDKWMKLVAENLVDELCLHFETSRGTWYSLPPTIYGAKSITTLNLYGCKLEQPFPKSTIRFNALQKLSLEEAFLDERVVQNIILSCPLIEDFFLRSFWGLKKFNASGLRKLKAVKIVPLSAEFESVDIEAPSLEIFGFYPNFAAPCTINLATCQGLKKLSLVGTHITDQLLHHLLHNFCLLEKLFLAKCNMLERVRILNHRLKKFTLFRCQKVVEAEISSPNLLSFKYSGITIPFLTIMNSSCRWVIDLQINSNVDLDTSWFFKLKQFLDMPTQRKVLNLYIRSRKLVRNTFNINEVGDISLPPPYAIQQLKLIIQSSVSSYDALLDGLLWSCHPTTIAMVYDFDPEIKFIKFLCEELMDREDPSCCISNHIKCWRHYLKNVKIEGLEAFGDGRPLSDALSTLTQGQQICYSLGW